MAIRYVAPSIYNPSERQVRRSDARQDNMYRAGRNLSRALVRQNAIDNALAQQAAGMAAQQPMSQQPMSSQAALTGPTDAEREAMSQRTFLGDPLAFGDAAPGVLGRASTGGVVSPSVAGGPAVDTAERQRLEESRQAARRAGLLRPEFEPGVLELDELDVASDARAEAGRRQYEAELAAIQVARELREEEDFKRRMAENSANVDREMAERVNQREREAAAEASSRDTRMGELDRGLIGQSAARVAASPYSLMSGSDDSELRFFDPAIQRILGQRERFDPRVASREGMPEGDDPLPFPEIPATTERYMDTDFDSTPQLIDQWRQWSNSPYAGTLEEGMAALKAAEAGFGDAWLQHFMGGTGRASEDVLNEMMFQMSRSGANSPDVPLPSSRSKAAKQALENNVAPGDFDFDAGMPLGDDRPGRS